MKFSFEGEFHELRELGAILMGAKENSYDVRVQLPEDTAKVVDKLVDHIENQSDGEIPQKEPAQDNLCVDPTTGDYYEKFKDMCAAFDKLLDAGKQDIVKELLATYSLDGTYGGVPSGKWGKVEKEALAALKKKKRKTKAEAAVPITVEELVAKATTFVKQDKAKNRPVLKELLKSYGVENISSLKESDYQEVDKSLDELLGANA